MVIRRYVCFMMYHLCKNERNELSNYHNRINNFNNMEKKNLLFVAAAMVMAGCASDDMIGDNNTTQSDNQVIGFNMSMPAMTRADYNHATSAEKLNNEFIVWGEKNESDAATDENIVFENYRVKYTASSANTATSNTKDWEYVGITPYNGSGTVPQTGDGDESNASVSPSIYADATTKQTIKYWDFGKNYTFTAVSAKSTDITSGKVKITKNHTENEALNKGYTIELADGASVGDIYVADRTTKKLTTKNTNAADDAVTLRFRNFQSKIRFGIYETVPGYKAVITGINYTGTETTGTSGKFGIKGNFIKAGTNTKYTVTYSTATGTADNKAEVKFTTTDTPAANQYLQTAGTTWLNTSKTAPVGTEATAPTWDYATTTQNTTVGNYTAILPNPSNTTDLELQVRYELYSEDTNEKIECGLKTVKVPAEYCQWKSNYAYTYLFKITDKSADLYPITFDAVVAQDEYTGEQETITTVDDPSITTYVKGKVQTAYAANDIIYAFGEDGTTTAMSADNMKLYKVTTTDGFEITEASVKHALEQTSVTTKITVSEITSGNDKPSYEAIPREDSTDSRTITGMKWTAQSSTTYAVKYIYNSKNYYKIIEIK